MLTGILEKINSLEKVLWGIMAMSPWMLLLFVVFLEYSSTGIPIISKQTPKELAITVSIILFSLFTTISFIIHALTNNNFSAKVKFEWVLLLFLTNIFSYPGYWWFHIWGEKKAVLFETSSNLNKEMVKPFLEKLSHVIDSGFDLSKVNELYNFTINIESEQETESVFYINHLGQEEQVIYRAVAIGDNIYSIYIYASNKVIKIINKEINLLLN